MALRFHQMSLLSQRNGVSTLAEEFNIRFELANNVGRRIRSEKQGSIMIIKYLHAISCK
jgi:hypothetical protein